MSWSCIGPVPDREPGSALDRAHPKKDQTMPHVIVKLYACRSGGAEGEACRGSYESRDGRGGQRGKVHLGQHRGRRACEWTEKWSTSRTSIE